MTTVSGARRRGDPAIVVRRATETDIRATYDVFVEAAEHLAATRGQAPVARPAEPTDRFLGFRRSALRHDPDGFWVAEADGRLVGFGIAVQRERVWYLAALHVRPAFQSRRIGAEIIRRAIEAAPPDSLYTVGADARNPVSNALYGRFGMFPEAALLELAGPVWRADTAALAPGQPAAAVLDELDRGILAGARPQDHEFWAATRGLAAFTVHRDGRSVGYAYVQADGAIGPIAVGERDDLAPALEAAIGVAAELGAATARVRIPGAARTAIAGLLAHGWRYGDGVTLALSSEPWGRWDRYVTSGADALL